MTQKKARANRPSESSKKMVRRSDGQMVPNDAHDPRAEKLSKERAEKRGGGAALRQGQEVRKERPESDMRVRRAQGVLKKVLAGDEKYIDSNPEEVAEAYGFLEARKHMRDREIEQLEDEIVSRIPEAKLGHQIVGANGEKIWLEDNRRLRFNAGDAKLTPKQAEECSELTFSQEMLEEKYPEEYAQSSFCTGGFYAKREFNRDEEPVDYKALHDPDSYLDEDLSEYPRNALVSRLAKLKFPKQGRKRKNSKGETESVAVETADYDDMRKGLASYGAKKIGGVNKDDSVKLAYERINDHGLSMESPQGTKVTFHPNKYFDEEHWKEAIRDQALEDGKSEKVASRIVERRIAEVTPMKIKADKVRAKFPKKWDAARHTIGRVEAAWVQD